MAQKKRRSRLKRARKSGKHFFNYPFNYSEEMQAL